jgi:hypothetical protein
MAGTLPHAIFIETNVDGAGGVAAYAAELPGCAVFAPSDEEAAAAMPRRVASFLSWLGGHGLRSPVILGDNWYEVERAAAQPEPDGLRRAAFSLDELPPSDDELAQWHAWLELAREELADAVDAALDPPGDALRAVADQDLGFARELGASPSTSAADPVGRLYEARDALIDALDTAGPAADGVRRILRLAIADDLRLAERLREARG